MCIYIMEKFINENIIITNNIKDIIYKNDIVEKYNKLNNDNIEWNSITRSKLSKYILYDKKKRYNGKKGFFLGCKIKLKIKNDKFSLIKIFINENIIKTKDNQDIIHKNDFLLKFNENNQINYEWKEIINAVKKDLTYCKGKAKNKKRGFILFVKWK